MKRKKNKFTIVFILLILLITAVGGIGFITYQNGIKPVSESSEEAAFVVNEGANQSVVLSNLESLNIIRDSSIAKIRLRLKGLSYEVKAGSYLVDKSWTIEEIMTYVSDSNNIVQSNVKRLTFIEGQWAKHYAQTIEKALGIPSQTMIDLWNNENYIRSLMPKYPFLTEDIFNENVIVYLEGYLAPNTFEFFLDVTPEEITEKLLDETLRIYNQNKALFDASELSVHQVYTLSSIVQFEASKKEDMQLVASVFMNRLAVPMRFESSVTVCYALYEYDNWEDCETNIAHPSPYNTYRVDGFPPGAVANPSPIALDAVLNVVESDYYYFIADVYGDGSVYFARTFSEHTENVNKYLK